MSVSDERISEKYYKLQLTKEDKKKDYINVAGLF